MIDYLYNHLWAMIAFLVIIHVGDYALTIVGAKKYKNQQHVIFEGSYELNPAFTSDIDQLKFLSPRFLWRLGFLILVYSAFWWALHIETTQNNRIAPESLFRYLLGCNVGVQFLIYLRHFTTISTFNILTKPNMAAGKIIYSRELLYSQSSRNVFAMAMGFLFLFAMLKDSFFFGAALGTFMLAVNHFSLSAKAKQEALAKAAGKPVPNVRQSPSALFLISIGVLLAVLLLMVLLALSASD